MKTDTRMGPVVAGSGSNNKYTIIKLGPAVQRVKGDMCDFIWYVYSE